MLAFPVAPVFAASMASSTCISTGGYAAFTSGATTTDAGSLSGSATVGSTESTTAATDAYFDACFAPAMPLVMNRHLVLQLPLAMLYATFYTYGFDAGS